MEPQKKELTGHLNEHISDEVYGFCPEVYEIHGNINFMRCASKCTNDLYPSPINCDYNFVPKCLKCNGIARPHVLFFDEAYEDIYYRTDSVIAQTMVQ